MGLGLGKGGMMEIIREAVVVEGHERREREEKKKYMPTPVNLKIRPTTPCGVSSPVQPARRDSEPRSLAYIPYDKIPPHHVPYIQYSVVDAYLQSRETNESPVPRPPHKTT